MNESNSLYNDLSFFFEAYERTHWQLACRVVS